MGRKHYRVKTVFQVSPFLDLPGEIRTLIYEAALIKPTPIDLWPHKYVEQPESDPVLMARIKKSEEEYNIRNCINDWRVRQEPRWKPKFRLQEDLQYARKEMATGLLATCKQISREATPIFWCQNTFRFSSDADWLGVRRFLETIGPEAICRLRKLEIFVPILCNPLLLESGTPPTIDWETIREAKNVPKLHMAKAGLGVKGQLDADQNMEIVTSLLAKAMATLELYLVLPRGFALNFAQGELVPNIYFPEQLQTKRPFTKVTVVVEAGAVVYTRDSPESHHEIASNGANFVLMPGSFWKDREETSDEEGLVSELKVWKSVVEELELLDGIQELMHEISPAPSVPGRGGKANKSPGAKKVERILKGFGESRLLVF